MPAHQTAAAGMAATPRPQLANGHEAEIKVPRDRKGGEETEIVKKPREVKLSNPARTCSEVTPCDPNTKVRSCIVHMARSGAKCVAYKDRKAVCRCLHAVYSASNEDEALE